MVDKTSVFVGIVKTDAYVQKITNVFHITVWA